MKTIFKTFILLGLLNVCVAANAEPYTLSPQFLEAETNLMFPHGLTLVNLSGEGLFILNRKQFDVLFDLWTFAKDEEAFQGKGLAILNDFEIYLETTDTILHELVGSMEKSKTLADNMKSEYDKSNEQFSNSLLRLNAINGQMETTASSVGKNTEKLIKKNKTQKTIIQALGYGLAITGGILLGQRTLK